MLQLRAVLGQGGVQELVLLRGLDHPAAVGPEGVGGGQRQTLVGRSVRRHLLLTGPVGADTPAPRCPPGRPPAAAGSRGCSR